MSKKKKVRPEPQSLDLPLVGVDTHAHLDMTHFAEDLDQVLDRARQSGVSSIGNVFMGPEAHRAGKERFDAVEGMFYILGIHPHDAKIFDDDCGAAMQEAFGQDSRLKALGEIGLDYHYDLSPRDVQVAVFRDQLAMARELDLPVVIHSREAEGDTLDILQDMGFSGRALMWHCFGGDVDLLRQVMAHGWHVSIPGPVSFSKNTALRRSVAEVPMQRMVLETDCPYLTPEPYRGKRNEPAYLAFTAQAVAMARDMSVEEVWQATADTARMFFGLDRGRQ